MLLRKKLFALLLFISLTSGLQTLKLKSSTQLKRVVPIQSDLDCDNGEFSDCTSCVAHSECGWCESSNKCLNATVDDHSPVQPCDIWYYHQCADRDRCADLSGCEDCLSAPECGWCNNQMCVQGNEEGPSNATDAVCHQWFYGHQDQCTQIPCDSYSDCIACSSDSSLLCGWCDDSNVCLHGNSNGPLNETCKKWNWGNCTEEVLDCEKNLNCSSCVNDKSEQCGWCESEHKCRNITYGQSSCQDWKQTFCKDACIDFSSDCDTCTQNKNCGWCTEAANPTTATTASSTTGTVPVRSLCVSGNATSAHYVNCSQWSYNNCTAISCASFANCSSCLKHSNIGCGWCISSLSVGKCVPELLVNAECPSSNGNSWSNLQCPTVNFPCESFSTCRECVGYHSNDCAWCGLEGKSASNSKGVCKPASEVGVKCSYVCGNNSNGVGIGTPVLAGIISACIAVVLAIAVFIWHRVYWTKRHYYERLR